MCKCRGSVSVGAPAGVKTGVGSVSVVNKTSRPKLVFTLLPSLSNSKSFVELKLTSGPLLKKIFAPCCLSKVVLVIV